jgi:superfamily II DNA or RNA helicase
VPHFSTCAGPSGSGKTYAATTFACERVPRNVKSAFIQPTIALCKQSYADARARFPDIKCRTKAIVSGRGSDDGIAHRITQYLNDRDETGDLFFATHAGLLRTPYWHRADTWNLFIDEAMEVAYHRKFRLKKYRHLLIDLFRVRPSRHQQYGVLEAKDIGDVDEALVDRI